MTMLDNLQKLHTTLIDTCRGYEEAVKDAGDSYLRPLFREMIDLRTKDHAEIHRMLLGKGVKPGDSGSFMSAVHRVVIDTRSAITGLDSSLPSFISGEENVVEAYDTALNESAADPAVAEVLKRQKQKLLNQISKMKEMQAA